MRPERRNLTATSVPRNAGRLALWVAGFTLSATVVLPAALPTESSNISASRVLSRHDEPLESFRCFRRMHAWADRLGQEGWLDAWTELKGGAFRYTVVQERGSDTVRSKVLHAILEREADAVNAGEVARGDLTPENYDFGTAGVSEDGSRYVSLRPKRKDVMLVDGRMVLSPDGSDLVRVEGRLSKNPSFWTTLVNVVRHYGRLGGVRVPTAVESTAKVRFAGTAQLEIFYEYETVNGRPVSLSAQRR
jgi:hypothetical protein